MSKRDRLDAVARHILTREGLTGFTMERLAEAAGVSRPTAYQYFGSREGALAATATRTLELCRKLFYASLPCPGTPREQLVAQLIGFELLARFEPDHLGTLEFLGMPGIKEALPEEILQTLRTLVTEFTHEMQVKFHRAVQAGELNLPPGYTVDLAVFHTLNICHGIFLAVLRRRITFEMQAGDHPWKISRRALHFFWNGIGWKPDPGLEGLDLLDDRILRQCYPEYWLRMKTEELRQGLETPLQPDSGLSIPERRPRRRAGKKAGTPAPGPGLPMP